MIAESEAFEGKYEILAKIREGGMGAIYKVRHRLLDEVRVIKVIRPHLSTSPEMGERFLREARLAIRVRHPNIAQLHDFSIDPDGTAYIVMEFIDGLTLADVLAGASSIPLDLALEVARGALDAIGYLHRRNMIHRDVSPDNLMLGRDEEGKPRVTLLDLGIAKSLVGSSVLTSTGAFLGKPRYASPEHFNAEGLDGVGPRSDLYSFGVVLYELLTGVCPVQGRDLSSWIAGHLFRPPLDFAESDREGRIPTEMREILLKVLAKAPEERFASAQEMIGALEPLRARYPVEPGALEYALEALQRTAVPALPPSPGTTQEALDRRFAPIQTPLPQTVDRPSTLVLTPRDAIPAPEAPRAQRPVEHTQVLLSVSAPERTAASTSSAPVLPEKVLGSTAPSLMRRLLPAVAVLILLVLSLGVWRMVRLRETPPAIGQAAEHAIPRQVSEGPAPHIPRPRQQPDATAPVSESLTDPVPQLPVPKSPKPQIARPAAEEHNAADSPKGKTTRETQEPPSASLPRERPAPATGSAEGAGRQQRNEEVEVRQVDPSSPAVESQAAAKSEAVMNQGPATPPTPTDTRETAPQFSPLQPPRVIRAPALEYPQEARGSGIHAVIILAVLVNTKGEPAKVELRRSMAKRGRAGKPPTPAQALAFQNAAFSAAYKTRFAPALRDGNPTEWIFELVEDFPPE